MAESFDIEGLKKKVANAKALRSVFLNVHRDAVTYFHGLLVDEVLNLPKDAVPGIMLKGGKSIRRITGMLARSVWPTFADFESKLTFNPSIAPYVFKVFDYAEKKYKMNPIQIVNFFYQTDVRKRAVGAIQKAFKQVADGEKVVYRNPFPFKTVTP